MVGFVVWLVYLREANRIAEVPWMITGLLDSGGFGVKFMDHVQEMPTLSAAIYHGPQVIELLDNHSQLQGHEKQLCI